MTVLAFLALSALGQSGEPAMEELITRLSSESPDTRDKATAEIQDAWKKWTSADLAKLRAAANSKEAEVAARARRAVECIEFYRLLPDETWKDLPQAGPILFQSSADKIGRLLRSIEQKWDKGAVSVRAAAPVLLELVEDDRDSQIQRPGRARGTYPIQVFARDLLEKVLPGASKLKSQAEGRAWWTLHRDKAEKDWHRPALNHEDEDIRARAIERLMALKDPELHPEIFKAFDSLDETWPAEVAADSFKALSPEVLTPLLRSSLKAAGLGARLQAAKRLPAAHRREAIDAVIEFFDNPKKREHYHVESLSQGQALEWLAKSKEDRAIRTALRCVGSGSVSLKLDAIDAIEELDDPRVDETLIKAIQDPETHYDLWSVRITTPRVCDWAGLALETRMKLEEREWPSVIRERENLLEDLQNRWRRLRGLPEVKFYGPGIVPTPPEKVAALVPDLAHDDETRRKGAWKRLSEFGPCAWRGLQGHIAGASGVERARLEEAALLLSNTLRSVTAENAAAAPYAELLKKRVNEPLDLEKFIRDAPDAWFDDAKLMRLDFAISREAEGRGISLKIDADKAPEKGMAPKKVILYVDGQGDEVDWDRPAFGKALKKLLAKYKDSLAKIPERNDETQLGLIKYESVDDLEMMDPDE